jgi:uncharacterized pyridoxamine 5'-phosphate oxidase family protein
MKHGTKSHKIYPINSESAKTIEIVRQLLNEQKVGILATIDSNKPYTSIVGFAATDDLKTIYFGTPVATLKYRNIQDNPNVSILIDNRKNLGSDFSQAAALTCMGEAFSEDDSMDQSGKNYLIDRHPELKAFFSSPSCKIVKICVRKYSLVLRFQEVTEIDMEASK